MNQTDKDKNPIPEKIGLCLSGGGYRAAGYHLGTLDYLDHLQLSSAENRRITMLSEVTMLSTVSGGTFTGLAYALTLAEGTAFYDFFNTFFNGLRDSRYIEEILKYLKEPAKDGKQRNMIQAAAEVYANTFLYDKKNNEPYRFEKILDAKPTDPKDPMPMFIFNATCFYTGLNFRFLAEPKGTQKAETDPKKDLFGTYYTTIAHDAKKKIRLGDIAAASSCFPAGFEPLAFPDDFDWGEGSEVPELIWNTYGLPPKKKPPIKELSKTIALMDGGVADNVGLNSLSEVYQVEHEKLDLIIASDVDPLPFDLYPDFPLKKESNIGLTINALDWIIFGVIIYAILTTISLGVFGWQHLKAVGFSLSILIHYLFAMVLSAVVACGLIWLRRLYRKKFFGWFDDMIKMRNKLFQSADSYQAKAWDIFKNLTLGQAINMATLRITSVFAMTNSVFMRCIRKLTYDFIYSNIKYKNKIIPSLIYKLTQAKYDPYFEETKDVCREHLTSSRGMKRVIEAVSDMDSTLWWEEDYQLPCLVASGQITLCFSLLKYYIDNYELDEECLPKTENTDVRDLFNTLVSDWEKLSKDPYALIKERYPGLDDPNILPYPPDENTSD